MTAPEHKHRGWKELAKRLHVGRDTIFERARMRDPLPLRVDHLGMYATEGELTAWIDRHRPSTRLTVLRGWPAIYQRAGVTKDSWKKRTKLWRKALPHQLDADGTPFAFAEVVDAWVQLQSVPWLIHQAANVHPTKPGMKRQRAPRSTVAQAASRQGRTRQPAPTPQPEH